MDGHKQVKIVGAAGYAGAEVVGLLRAHPYVTIAGLYGSGRDGDAVAFDEVHPRFRDLVSHEVHAFDVATIEPDDVVFLATPAEFSGAIAPALVERGAVVFDLSGAHRLDDAAHAATYARVQRDDGCATNAIYGLPELDRVDGHEPTGDATLYAVAGCYATAVIIAVAPLVHASAVAPNRPIIADATSGVSGAGRGATSRTHFCEVSLQPYAVLEHRHEPEIIQHAGHDVVFTPHLAPYARGIVATVHVPLAPDWGAADVAALFASQYGDEPFVRVCPAGGWPTVAGVERTNCVDLACAVDERRGHAVVVTALDNLVKGAAGQAVQVMNAHFGWPETIGLPGVAAMPAGATGGGWS